MRRAPAFWETEAGKSNSPRRGRPLSRVGDALWRGERSAPSLDSAMRPPSLINRESAVFQLHLVRKEVHTKGYSGPPHGYHPLYRGDEGALSPMREGFPQEERRLNALSRQKVPHKKGKILPSLPRRGALRISRSGTRPFAGVLCASAGAKDRSGQECDAGSHAGGTGTTAAPRELIGARSRSHNAPKLNHRDRAQLLCAANSSRDSWRR
jgi:hypothetical protein